MGIADWPEDERPREKLLQRGAAVLSDAELLAVFLRTGVKGKSAVDLGRDLLARFGSLSALIASNQEACIQVNGFGPAKYAQLAAMVELVRRAIHEEMRQGDALSSPESVRNYLRLAIGRREIEVFVVLFLSAQNRVVAVEEMSHGTLTEARVYPREVARHALNHNASAVIVAHNHPSGEPTASDADKQLTKQLSQVLGLFDIRLLDHFIIAGHRAESFAEQGWL